MQSAFVYNIFVITNDSKEREQELTTHNTFTNCT